MCSRLEHCPVEVWLDFFRFLTAEHIVSAFNSLNTFVNSVLASPHLPIIFRIKLDRHHIYPVLPTSGCLRNIELEWIQTLNTNEHIHRGVVVQFLRYHAPRLISLRSVKVYVRAKRAASNLDYLSKALTQFRSLQVFHLVCIQGPVAKTLSFSIAQFLMTILQLSRLHHCILDLWNLQENNFNRESITDLPLNHSIEYLSLNRVDRQIFFDIISCCQGLKSLSAGRNEREDIFVQSDPHHSERLLSLPALRILKLSICNLTFNELECIHANVSLHLRSLQLTYSVHVYTNHYEDYLDYFDQNRWKKLLNDIEVVDVAIKINPLDAVANDVISNMVKIDSRCKWIENKTSPSYAHLIIKRAN